MMAMDNRKLILGRLAQHVDEIHGFTKGLPESQLAERPSPTKWSLKEIAMHLIDTQDVFVERVTRILTEENPTIVPFTPDKAQQEGAYLSANLERRMNDFDVQRRNLFTIVRDISDAQWKREGIHPDVKHYTVEKCLEALMRHEEHHLLQMFNVFFGVKS